MTKVKDCKINTREEAEELAGQIAALEVSRTEMVNEMERRIQAIRAEYAARITENDLMREEFFPALEAWARENCGAWGAKKSLEMLHAVIGFRTGMPRPKPIKGETWEKIKARLVNRGLGYTRTSVEVDKQGIVTDRELLGETRLKEMGIKIVQDEAFFCEAKKEQVD